ncbi:TlpA family protein disulfide reductase [Longivirga aurantiaca]|uniref:TlpA family protein disulfide reductase n=1 Tax=Longivirga aurantiaca TaxID=1837743 RepID=A0ABW1SX01_9ACTN
MTGVYVVLGVLVLATAFGLYRRRTDGTMREVEIPADTQDSKKVPGAPIGSGHAHQGDRMDTADLGVELGDRATLVQFSSAFCAPCRTTRVILDEVAGQVEGVTHVEIDAEEHLDLVRRMDVRRTPTVLVLDASGAVRVRAAGAPRKADVVAALGTFL